MKNIYLLLALTTGLYAAEPSLETLTKETKTLNPADDQAKLSQETATTQTPTAENEQEQTSATTDTDQEIIRRLIETNNLSLEEAEAVLELNRIMPTDRTTYALTCILIAKNRTCGPDLIIGEPSADENGTQIFKTLITGTISEAEQKERLPLEENTLRIRLLSKVWKESFDDDIWVKMDDQTKCRLILPIKNNSDRHRIAVECTTCVTGKQFAQFQQVFRKLRTQLLEKQST